MLQQIELWGFLAGLGLFLLGMYMLEQGLRGLGSRSMKKFLREQTRSPNFINEQARGYPTVGDPAHRIITLHMALEEISNRVGYEDAAFFRGGYLNAAPVRGQASIVRCSDLSQQPRGMSKNSMTSYLDKKRIHW